MPRHVKGILSGKDRPNSVFKRRRQGDFPQTWTSKSHITYEHIEALAHDKSLPPSHTITYEEVEALAHDKSLPPSHTMREREDSSYSEHSIDDEMDMFDVEVHPSISDHQCCSNTVHQVSSAGQLSFRDHPVETTLLDTGGRLTSTTSEEEIRPILKSLHNSARLLLSWESLLGLLSIIGSVPFSSRQFDVLRDMIDTASSGERQLCTYKTVRQSHWNYLLQHIYPRSNLLYVQTKDNQRRRPTQSVILTQNNNRQDSRDCIRLLLPSEWALLDVLTLPIYQQLFGEESEGERPLSIERSQLVQGNRHRVLGGRHTFWVLYRDSILPSMLDDMIEVRCSVPDGNLNQCMYTSWKPDTGSSSSTCRDTHRDIVRIHGRVGPMWCVAPHNESTPLDELLTIDMVDMEKSFYAAFRSATVPINCHTFGDRLEPALELFPADICTFLRPAGPNVSNLICIMVSSFIGKTKGCPAERLIWIERSSGNWIPKLSANVSDLPSLVAKPDGARLSSFKQMNKGVLTDGTTFLVYRFILYSDGFNQHKSMKDTKSVCGCYIMPLGLSENFRKTSASARVITMSASKQDINSVLSNIVDDIVRGATTGFEGTDPFGGRVKVFLDLLANVGDYPAASACSDLMGHTANTPCSVCTFPRRKGTGTGELVYSSGIHSRRLSNIRFDERMRAIRSEGALSDHVRKSLGVNCRTVEEASAKFNVQVASALRESVLRLQLKGDGTPVVPGVFDSYLSTAILPDHLLTGLIKNVLHVCFRCLNSDGDRHSFDEVICSYISETNLPSIDSILVLNRGKFSGLQNLSMSSLFIVLLFASHLFDLYDKRWSSAIASPSPFHLPMLLQRIVEHLYWYPSTTTDSSDDFDYVLNDNGERYQQTNMQRLTTYINAMNSYIAKVGRHGHELDKPNAHRLIELCVHTVPIFGHTLLVSELVLEMFHRGFKKWLETNPNHDAHVTAVEVALGRDWGARLYALHMYWSHGTEHEKNAAERGLQRLLLGKDIGLIPDDNSDLRHLLDVFRKSLPSMFKKPVVSLLHQCRSRSMLPLDRQYWRSQCIQRDVVKFPNYFQQGARLLQGLRPGTTFQAYKEAVFKSVEQFSDVPHSQRYNKIREGSFVSVMAESPDVTVLSASKYAARRSFYVVVGIASDKREDWIFVKRMKATADDDVRYVLCDTSGLQLVRLSRFVQRAAAIHVCTSRCRIHDNAAHRLHQGTVFDGQQYRLCSRADGYPPHLG